MASRSVALFLFIAIGALASGRLRAQDPAAGPDSNPPSTSGGDANAPAMILQQVNPDPSENAVDGKVILTLVVDKNGTCQNIKVKQGLFDSSGNDVGLNDKAVEAVRKWRFRPGMRNGKPVDTKAVVEITFKRLKK